MIFSKNFYQTLHRFIIIHQCLIIISLTVYKVLYYYKASLYRAILKGLFASFQSIEIILQCFVILTAITINKTYIIPKSYNIHMIMT